MGLLQLLQSMTTQERIASHNSNNSFLQNLINAHTARTDNPHGVTPGKIGAATINGYADQPWTDMPGMDTSGLKFIRVNGLDENQIYQVVITGCYNPAGSPNYRATLSGKLSFPVGYANGVITVKVQFLQELTINGVGFTGDGNFYALLEGGGATLPYSTWASNKIAYIRWSRDPSSLINNWRISIKKLLP